MKWLAIISTILTVNTVQAGTMDLVVNSLSRATRPTVVTEFRNADGVLMKNIAENTVQSKKVIDNFNDGIFRTTLTVRNKLMRPDYLAKYAISEKRDIISAILPDQSIIRVHLVSVASMNPKSIKTSLIVITDSSDQRLLNGIDDIFIKETQESFEKVPVLFGETNQGLSASEKRAFKTQIVGAKSEKYKTIPVNIKDLKGTNESLLKLSDLINEAAAKSSINKVYLSKKAQKTFDNTVNGSR